MDDQFDIFGGSQDWQKTTSRAQKANKAETPQEHTERTQFEIDVTILGWLGKWDQPLSAYEAFTRIERMKLSITDGQVRASFRRLAKDRLLRREGDDDDQAPVSWNPKRYVPVMRDT